MRQRRIRPSSLYLPFVCLVVAAGCASPPGSGFFAPRRAPVTPVLAVMDFENKANFNGQWNLGYGMAEVLTTKLMETRRVTVLERQHLDDVVGEIVRQGTELFRPEGRAARGRLMNAQYVVRGAVTDFTVTEQSSGWVRYATFGLFGHGSRARVAIHLRISDVASGEVVASVKTEGTASAGGFAGEATYKNMAFGGDSFFRTPLGQATESAAGRAVKQILKGLPKDCWHWQPRVAEVAGAQAVINGGRNVGVKPGDRYVVREAVRSITDQVTGNVIERLPGQVIGHLQVTEVRPASSSARILQGRAERNDVLEEYREKE
jgi:curli biogenesis system outer membrane secretion channel CsgG